MNDQQKLLTEYHLHLNLINGNEYGLPDNVEIKKFLLKYNQNKCYQCVWQQCNECENGILCFNFNQFLQK